jgi:hypothetical protein
VTAAAELAKIKRETEAAKRQAAEIIKESRNTKKRLGRAEAWQATAEAEVAVLRQAEETAKQKIQAALDEKQRLATRARATTPEPGAFKDFEDDESMVSTVIVERQLSFGQAAPQLQSGRRALRSRSRSQSVTPSTEANARSSASGKGKGSRGAPSSPPAESVYDLERKVDELVQMQESLKIQSASTVVAVADAAAAATKELLSSHAATLTANAAAAQDKTTQQIDALQKSLLQATTKLRAKQKGAKLPEIKGLCCPGMSGTFFCKPVCCDYCTATEGDYGSDYGFGFGKKAKEK